MSPMKTLLALALGTIFVSIPAMAKDTPQSTDKGGPVYYGGTPHGGYGPAYLPAAYTPTPAYNNGYYNGYGNGYGRGYGQGGARANFNFNVHFDVRGMMDDAVHGNNFWNGNHGWW